jgi:short subunit dehydrogenase-like uncharacterized protein
VTERDFDVVVFGASGVTGRRVAGYLAGRAGDTGHTWAAAARDVAKVRRVLAEEGVESPEVIEADSRDPASLAAMASRARVVLNLVGPYTVHGEPVVEACVAAGAHYADICGEIPFVRRTIDAFHSRAADAGLKVVQVCGVEALPPDLAVRLAAEAARERWGEGLATADVELDMGSPPGIPRPSDGLSGGTLQSMAVAATLEDAAITDPAALVVDAGLADVIRRLSPIEIRPRRGTGEALLAPVTPAAFITPPVIHRTAALVAADGGTAAEPFRYREGMALRGGPLGLPLRYAAAGALYANQAFIRRVGDSGPVARRRWSRVLQAVYPSSGFGPASERMERWRWGLSVHARTTGGHDLRVEVDADGHPAYLATARWLGEAGLLLAEEGATPPRGGCLTPATGLGTACVSRLSHAGLRFSTVS